MKKYKLGEIGEVRMCKRIMKHETNSISGVPFYKIGTFGNTADVFISKEKFDDYKSKYYYPKKGDVLISAAGTIGRTVIYDGEDAYFQDSNIVWIDNDETKVLNSFLFYAYQNIHWKISNGSTILRLYNDDLKSTQITAPNTLSEQKRIAKVLSDIDAKIALNKKINQELEAMAKEIYDYWFIQFDYPAADGKPYKTSGGKMHWNEILKRPIPANWEVKSLLDIATFTNGLACQNFRPKNKNKLPVIKIREMRDGFTNDTEWVTSDIPNELKVYDGDILFSWSASLEVMIWSYGTGGLNQHIFKVNSQNGYPKSFYYYNILNYIDVFKRMAEARKTTMGHITQDHLRQSRIAVPKDISIIHKLDNLIEPIFNQIVKNTQQVLQLTQLRNELLPLLMNGQVAV